MPTNRLASRLPRKQLADDVLEGDVLDRDVVHGALGQDLLENLGHVLTRDVECDLAFVADLRRAVRGLPFGAKRGGLPLDAAQGGRLRPEPDDALAGPGAGDAVEVAVVDLLAVVDDDHPLAELRDVGHVVAREQDRRLVLPVVLAQAHGSGTAAARRLLARLQRARAAALAAK